MREIIVNTITKYVEDVNKEGFSSVRVRYDFFEVIIWLFYSFYVLLDKVLLFCLGVSLMVEVSFYNSRVSISFALLIVGIKVARRLYLLMG